MTIKVDPELKKRMSKVDENWSAYLREAIRLRLELEERKSAAESLLHDIKAGKRLVQPGFIEATIREARETR